MVQVDGVKYACSSCIKGHRSSKCTHTTRTLIEIKKKGRPTSQCTHCRDLRKTRAVHGRCDCAARELEVKPQAKVLQNGLSDIVKSPSPPLSDSATTAAPKARVAQLLNPCNCRRGGKCNCCSVIDRSKGKGKAIVPSTPALSESFSTPSGSCCSPKTELSVADAPAITPFTWSADPNLFQSMPTQSQTQEPFLLLDSTSTWPPTYQSFQGFSFASDLGVFGTTSPLTEQQSQVQSGMASAGPVASSSGGCCGNKDSHQHQSIHQQQQQVMQQVPVMQSPMQTDSFAGIPAFSMQPAFQAAPSFTAFPLQQQQQLQHAFMLQQTQHPMGQQQQQSHTPLFLPTTHGTSACFCGDLCTCIGCPQHDPYGRRGQTPIGRNNCQCDLGKEQTGAPKACCGGGGTGQISSMMMQTNGQMMSTEEMMKTMVDGCAMNLPQLWPDGTLPGTLAPQQSTLGVLPSLSQIWGDAGGLEYDFGLGMVNGDAAQQHQVQSGEIASLSRKRKTPSGQSPTAVEARLPAPPVWNGDDMSFGSALASEGSGCGAMYAKTDEAGFDDSHLLGGGCGDACTCSSDCGCRTGIELSEESDMVGTPIPDYRDRLLGNDRDTTGGTASGASTPMNGTDSGAYPTPPAVLRSYSCSTTPMAYSPAVQMKQNPFDMAMANALSAQLGNMGDLTTMHHHQQSPNTDHFASGQAGSISDVAGGTGSGLDHGQLLGMTPKMDNLSLTPSMSPLIKIAELAAAGFT